jgi:hypothetical protein
MAPILAYQPFKALYTLLAVAFESMRFPLWFLLYLHRAGRPHAKWTLGQAIRMRVVKAFLAHSSAVEVKTPLSLDPGKEKDRFVVMEPASADMYKGPAYDSEITAATIGGTWTPKPFIPSKQNAEEVDVVLHFHGGAYVCSIRLLSIQMMLTISRSLATGETTTPASLHTHFSSTLV